MFRLLAALFCSVIVISLTSCSVDSVKSFFADAAESISEIKIVENTKDFFNGLVESIGTYSITDDDKLIGTRTCDDDGYFSGEYYAECFEQTTKESVFGGASTKKRKVIIRAKIDSFGGEVIIRVRKNKEVFEFKTDSKGEFEQTLSFDGGGNYIMLSYDNFSGIVRLTVIGEEHEE